MPIIDFAILTGLLEEFEILQKLFPPLQSKSDNAAIWYRTQVTALNHRVYSVVMAFQNEMGPLDALDLTNKVVARWNPAYILLLGIAGSFDKEVKLGDVVVSQQVFYYDLAKATDKKLKYRPQGYPCSTVLVRQVEALRVDPSSFQNWRHEAQQSAGAKAASLDSKKLTAQKLLINHDPEIHFGTVASGSLVIADKSKKEELLRLHGRILATEMEGAGVLHATFRQEIPTPAIVIKGISDPADKNKSALDAIKHWRTLAEENSVRLVLELIRRGKIRPLHTDMFSLDRTQGPPAMAMSEIRQGATPGNSYCAFPRLIVPQGPLTELSIRVQASGEFENKQGDLAVTRFLVKYRARGETVPSTQFVNGNEFKLNKTLRPFPVEVYLLLRGEPRTITFQASSPRLNETITCNF